MSALDDILGSLPIDQLADQLGADPSQVQAATAAVLPALLGGLQANASDGGAGSLLQALGQHNNGLLDGGVDLSQIDVQEGQAIAGHIFGDHQDAVANQLGGLGASAGGSGIGGALVKKLIPILAPIVLSYIANQVFGKMGQGGGTATQSIPQGSSPSLPTPSDSGSAGSAGGPGSLEDMLKDVLGSAAGSAGGSATQARAPQQQGMPSGGSIITDILGGLLGGGRR